MKKIYVMAAFLGATSFAFNQVIQETPVQTSVNTDFDRAVSTNYTPAKALGTPLWEDDFDDPTTWVIDNDGKTGKAVGWNIDTEFDGWTSWGGDFAPASGGNFAELGNGTDPNSVAALDVVYTLTTKDPIDLSSATDNNLNLEFLQFGARFNDAQEFQISTDGTTFKTVGSNANKEMFTSTGGAPYPNPDLIMINLKEHLPASPGNVWVRFKWTSAYPTEMINNAWITYGWLIDDVKITTLPDNDIATSNLYYGSEGVPYFQIPEAQIAPIEFTINVKNQGVNDQTGVALLAKETAAGYNGTSGGKTIVAGAKDSLIVTNPFTPNGQGSYKVDFSIENDDVDDVPSNNIIKPYRFTVGQNIYARDTSTKAKEGTVYSQLSQYGLAGNNRIKKFAVGYDIYNDADLTGVDFQFGNSIVKGAQVVAQVYQNDLETLLGETEYYTVAANDGGKYHTLVFDEPVMLSQGNSYFVAIELFSDSLSLAAAGSAPRGTSLFQLLDNSWSNLAPVNFTYVIRMNFDPTLSVEDNELTNLNVSQNFPNPFANETTVQFSLKEATDVSYTVVDLTGKVITNVVEGKTMAGDHQITIDGSSFANGVYYLNINAGESTVTSKMIVNK